MKISINVKAILHPKQQLFVILIAVNDLHEFLMTDVFWYKNGFSELIISSAWNNMICDWEGFESCKIILTFLQFMFANIVFILAGIIKIFS